MPDAIIHMFEPSLSVYNTARDNLERHEVTINNLALGKDFGKRKFFIYGNSEISSLHENDNITKIETRLVDTTTIDAYCYLKKIGKINYLKIDTEGHDFFVLKGAEKMLNDQKINCIQFEYGSPNIYSRVFLKDIINYLKSKNYFIFRIYPSWIKPINDYTNELENFILVNYISVNANMIERLKHYIKR